mgnify:CR=1 FL=1
MAYPPEFSSTLTYANRYDLDEIDVFLEGDSNNPMFFNVSQLPNHLSYGKHYFNLTLLNSENQQYELRPGSKILFEFKSKNNVVLRSDISETNQRNGVITCFVEVLNDPLRTFKYIEDGEGTLTVVGSLKNKISSAIRPNYGTINMNNLQIPEKFQGAMNYRCTFPIDIRKNIINGDSPFVLQTEHKTSTSRGQFSFTKANIPSRKYASVGNTYGTNGYPDNPYSTQDLGETDHSPH